MQFLEKGRYYNQTMTLYGKSIEFDVPKHADIEQAKYLYDYDAVSCWDLFLKMFKNLQEFLNIVV